VKNLSLYKNIVSIGTFFTLLSGRAGIRGVGVTSILGNPRISLTIFASTF
jgi:hypothetical protein